mgnify:CR=1 FL=1
MERDAQCTCGWDSCDEGGVPLEAVENALTLAAVDAGALAGVREFERERSFLTALLNGGGTEFATNPDDRSVTGVSF